MNTWIADLHCDSVLRLLEDEEAGRTPNIIKNDHHIDLEGMKKAGYGLQTFALFTDRGHERSPEHQVLRLYHQYLKMIEQARGELVPILTRQDLERARREGKIGALLSLEEGDVMFQDLALLDLWSRFGVRMIALTWNYTNAIGCGNFEMRPELDYTNPAVFRTIETKKGLTEFGKQFVQEMEKLHILPDVSHLSDKGFWDVMETATGPVFASHSNARALTDVPRNLSDDMIKAIADKGGLIGINFCAGFLDDFESTESTIQDILRHIHHIKKVGGIDCLALGTDYDGIDSKLEIENCSKMPVLQQALLEDGFTQEEVSKIMGENVRRVLMEVLPDENER